MAEKLKMTRGSGNVFRDLGFSEPEAQNLLLRTDLMIAIQRSIRDSGLSQTDAAKKLGITQPRLSDLFRHRIERFSLDALVNLADARRNEMLGADQTEAARRYGKATARDMAGTTRNWIAGKVC